LAHLKIYFDGGNYKNRVCVYNSLQNDIVVKAYNHKDYTNNELEYKALIEAIRYANKNYPHAQVTFIGDSRLVINQVWYGWKINHEHLKKLNHDVHRILPHDAKGRWINRDNNLAGVHLENLKRKGA